MWYDEIVSLLFAVEPYEENNNMDPLTTIVAAFAAGVAISTGEVGKKVVVDAYEALKAAIHAKVGGDSEVAKAIDGLEKKPDSNGRREILKEDVKAAQLHKDPEVVKLAEALLEQVNAQPGGAQFVQQATGNYIAQAGQGSSASVNIGQSEQKK